MNKQSNNTNTISSLDGFPRDKELEEQISMNFTSLFSTPSGKEVLKYLRSITIEAVHGSAVTDEVLRHAEGQRFIVGLIERRVQHGIRIKSNG